MTDQTQARRGARVLAARDGEILASVGGVSNRFVIDGTDTGGRFALVQHLIKPNSLAAPMHRHHDEDEYTYVFTGRIGAVLGDEEIFGQPGDLIFKPRPVAHVLERR